MRWFSYGTLALAVTSALLGLAMLWMIVFPHVPHYEVTVHRPAPKPLPQSFRPNDFDYESLGVNMLDINSNPSTLRLPDLQSQILYFGKNRRPDADTSQNGITILLRNNPEGRYLEFGKPYYLAFDSTTTPPRYRFTPDNQPAPLWIEVSSGQEGLLVTVQIRDPQGNIIDTPARFAKFSLKGQETSGQTRPGGWEVGSEKADSSLLAKQRARWYGQDLLLRDRGGEEYRQMENSERIDFTATTPTYCVYVKPGTLLAWKEGMWVNVIAGPDSWGAPLLEIISIDKRALTAQLWDPEGTTSIRLTLVRTPEPPIPSFYEQEFKFLGAKSWSQFLLRIGDTDYIVKPNDWLLRTEAGWHKIETAAELMDYVNRNLIGELFIFDKIDKKQGQQVLIGTLYSAGRTEKKVMELVMQTASGKAVSHDVTMPTQHNSRPKPFQQRRESFGLRAPLPAMMPQRPNPSPS